MTDKNSVRSFESASICRRLDPWDHLPAMRSLVGWQACGLTEGVRKTTKTVPRIDSPGVHAHSGNQVSNFPGLQIQKSEKRIEPPSPRRVCCNKHFVSEYREMVCIYYLNER